VASRFSRRSQGHSVTSRSCPPEHRPGNIADYLCLPAVLACGGSWMVAPALLASGNFDQVEELARGALAIVAEVRGKGGPLSEEIELRPVGSCRWDLVAWARSCCVSTRVTAGSRARVASRSGRAGASTTWHAACVSASSFARPS